MKSIGPMHLIGLSVWMLAASAVAAPGIGKDNFGVPVFSSTNLVVLKQADGQQKPATNWPGYLAVAIAALVALVEVRQYLVAREKLKLDLFEKRFAVFEAAQKFLETVVRDPPVGWDEQQEFLRGTQVAAFLFGPKVVEYLDGQLNQKALKIMALRQGYEQRPPGAEREAQENEVYELVQKLAEELPKLPEHFAPYLRFRVWKRMW
jgi:hypothetical protein